jgi:hypothetical protein
MVNATFRANFPEFADLTAYPNSQLDFWASVAEKMVVKCVWDDMYENGVMLYVAHELVLARQNVQAAAVGGLPGQGGGIASSKTVGSVSVNYDPNSTTEKNAGWWNLTNYGKQFYRLTQIFGAGCIQL